MTTMPAIEGATQPLRNTSKPTTQRVLPSLPQEVVPKEAVVHDSARFQAPPAMETARKHAE